MANYPQLDNASGVWKLREVYDAVMGGYWPNANSTGLFFGGFSPAYVSTIAKVNISSPGDATVFGDLSVTGPIGNGGAVGSFTRAIFAGGVTPSSTPVAVNPIQYVTFATEGNTADFGDLTNVRERLSGASNSTRGVFPGGFANLESPDYKNIIDYVTMTSTGNATDFGDLTQARRAIASAASPTRAIFGGGDTGSTVNTIDFIELSTTGNATDFGDLTKITMNAGGASSSTRYVCVGGNTPTPSSTSFTTLEFVTIASQGNATDYGDLTISRQSDSANNSVKSVNYAGFNNPAGVVNTIDIFTINTGGTATDFGDALTNNFRCRGASNSHGGLNDGYQGTRPLPFNEAGGDRGIIAGGQSPGTLNEMGFITISSTGNENDFGDLTQARQGLGGIGGKTRAIFGGGNASPVVTASAVIDYVEFSTKGNAADFGDLTSGRFTSGANNNTRGVFMAGATPTRLNIIDYVTISTLGNAADFGDTTIAVSQGGATASNTRAVRGGGSQPSPYTNVLDYITISTTGNATDFGDLSVTRNEVAAVGSDTRGVWSGGEDPSALSNVMDYITIATTGNATDFGDLLDGTQAQCRGNMSNTTRGVYANGATPSLINVMQYITISSTGNAVDFGDTITAKQTGASVGNGQGGLIGG